MKKVTQARPLAFPRFSSVVDIIIPFHGQYQLVINLVNSILMFTRSNYYHLCLVDDCSDNENFLHDVCKEIQEANARNRLLLSVRKVRCDKQLGWGGACFRGYQASDSPYVCFIHSDCEVTHTGWLKNLGECLLRLKEKNVRLVVPLTNNSVGGCPEQESNLSKEKDQDVIVPLGEFLTLYCFLCHRQLFDYCGGFIKAYPYGWYEEQEFACRMNYYGFQQAICTSSWIKHIGSATINQVWKKNPNIKHIMEEKNRLMCMQDMAPFCQKTNQNG